MNLTPPTIVTRLGKGSALTWQEGDDNITGLRDYITGLTTVVDPVLNSNGTLKILHTDTGTTANTYQITPENYLAAYADGLIYLVKAASTNQGASTLAVANTSSTFLAAVPIRKHGNTELVAGDILGGDVFLVVYRNGIFEFVSSGTGSTTSTGGTTGTSGTTTDGNSDFVHFTPADVAVPTTVATFSHDLGAVPTQVIAYLVNVIANKGYSPGDIVPIDEFMDASGGNPNFSVVFNEETIDIVAKTATPFVAALDASSAFQAITLVDWKLRVHAYTYTGADRYESEQTTLTGANTELAFTHSLGTGAAPTVQAVLVATVAEPGTDSDVGDNVPLSCFTDVNGNPAFAIRVTSSQILITQKVNQPFLKLPITRNGTTHTSALIDSISTTADLVVGMTVTGIGVQTGTVIATIPGGGVSITVTPNTTASATVALTFGAIVQASWKMQVRAFLNIKPSTAVIPAMGMVIAGPDAAVGYGNKVYLFHNGRFGHKSHVSQWDLLDNSILRKATSLLTPNTSIPWQTNINPALFNYGGTDMILWTSTDGVFSLPAADASLAGAMVITQYGPSVDRRLRKPVWYTEDGSMFPEMYLAASVYQVDGTTGLPLSGFGITGVNLQRYKQTGSSTWVASGLGPLGGTLNNLNLTDSRIIGDSPDPNNTNNEFKNYHSANAALVLFQYNQIKRRIYVITVETGLLYIFNILAYGTNDIASWWEQADATRYPQLAYEKAVSLAGFGTGYGSSNRESYCVEFDLVTGQEQSICFTRIDNVSLLGSVTRVPWRES